MSKCSVCGGFGKQHSERCVFGNAEKEAEFNRQRLAVWRDDRSPQGQATEFPTINTIVRCAEDVTDVRVDGYSLVIVHINSFPRGKGFMPSFYSGNGYFCGNGDVALTYEEALQAGKTDLEAMVQRRNDEYAQALAEECRRQEERNS